MKKLFWSFFVVSILLIVTLIGSSYFLLDYSLSPDPNRFDTDSCFKQLFDNYPETIEWVDSLNNNQALCDTFITMPEGYCIHAYYVKTGSPKTALIVHGWRDQAIKFFYLARMYEQEFGYNVIIPDLYASGKSDGKAIRMGWFDRMDMIRLLQIFKTDTIVVHGVSMGGATAMMMINEPWLKRINDLRFIDDCGYTSVWGEFAWELRNTFGLPEFPLMYTASALCKYLYGWSFGEASAISQTSKSQYPVLFIHGDKDTFVPTEMALQMYAQKPNPKKLWITENTAHARSYKNHKDEYIRQIGSFINY